MVGPDPSRLRRARLTGLVPLAVASVLVAVAPSPITWVLVVAALTLAGVWFRGAGPRSQVTVAADELVVRRGRRVLVSVHRLEVDDVHVGEQGISAAIRVVHRGGESRVGLAGVVVDELLAALTDHGWPASRAADPRREGP